MPNCRHLVSESSRTHQSPRTHGTKEAVHDASVRWVEVEVLLTRRVHMPRAVKWRRDSAGDEARGLQLEEFRRSLDQCRQRMVPPEAGNALRLRSEEHTSELQSHSDLVCRLL